MRSKSEEIAVERKRGVSIWVMINVKNM